MENVTPQKIARVRIEDFLCDAHEISKDELQHLLHGGALLLDVAAEYSYVIQISADAER